MSKRQNQNVAFWKDVEDHLRRTEVVYSSRPLPLEDSRLVQSGILLQALVMNDLRIGRVASPSAWKRWALDVVRLDFKQVALALKDWVNYLRNYVPGWHLSSDDFKRRFKPVYPFTGAFWAPVKDDLDNFFETGDSTSFAVLNQHVSFLTRTNLRSVDFSAEMLAEYLSLEDELSSQTFPSSIVEEINSIMKDWLQNLSWENYTPRHGNGAVAFLGRAPMWQKYENLRTDAMLEYCMRGDALLALPEMGQGLDRCCEVRFVAKSALTWRTISMEPATLQFIQQGYARSLDSYFRRHGYLCRRIDFADQERNRRLAAEGSANRGSFATIDLSSASDRVSWKLVKSLFHSTPLERPIWASRSRWAALPSGGRIPLNKYAPMGSALCFPVESLVFAGICEYAIRSMGRAPRESRYVVYGDDIIIEAEFAPTVCTTLEVLGFKVNKSKTFIAQNLPFRESCGGEYYNGVDVTPFRISRRFSGVYPSKERPEVIQAYIDLCNEAGRLGLVGTRRWFIHQLFAHLPPRLLPPFTSSEGGIHSPEPTNFHLVPYWHEKKDIKKPSFQCWFVRCGGLRTKEFKPSEERHETIRLYEWFRQTRFREKSPGTPEEVTMANLSREVPIWAAVDHYCPSVDTSHLLAGVKG